MLKHLLVTAVATGPGRGGLLTPPSSRLATPRHTVPTAAARPAAAVPAFRPDVEGLRALAIGLVVLAHAGLQFAPGGYVGVDIFFVISGFLITRMLVGELEGRHAVSLVTFYARRIKRLMPQALLAVTAVVVASWLLLPQLRARAVAGDVMAAAGYATNWRFAAQSVDYFATGSADRPLDHFWSLAVEEQFYLVWPLLLVVLTHPWRHRPRSSRAAVGVALGAISLASLLYATWLAAVTPTQAYFSTPARAWELGLGGLLAVAPLRRLPSRLADASGWCGLAAIGAATVAYGSATAFPGPAALLPTLGAAALIVAGASTRPALPTRTLSRGPITALGRMSYAWYIWHWPVFVFAAAALGPLSLGAAALVMALSLVPAVITHRWVEEPVRRSDLHRRHPRLTLTAAPVAAALMLLLGLGLGTLLPSIRTAPAGAAIGAAALHSGARVQASAAMLRPAPQNADADRGRPFFDGCFVAKTARRSPPCLYGDPRSATTVVLFGDSHAMQYFSAIAPVASRRRWRLLVLTKSGCPSADVRVRDFLLGRAYPECDDWRRAALERIDRIRPDMVITSGDAVYQVLDGARVLGSGDNRAALVAGYRRTFAHLRQVAHAVTVIHDTPRPPFDIPSCVAEAMRELRRCAFSRAGARRRADPISIAARGVPGVRLLDPIGQFCLPAVCPAVIGNVIVYRRTGHITATYMATMAPWFARHLPGA